MNDRNFWRGLFLMGVAAVFATAAMQYATGSLVHAGPGLFPLMVSGLLFFVALSIAVRACFVRSQPLEIRYRNIAIILASLCTFALVTHLVNMIAGIVALIFMSGLAAATYSWRRNAQVTAGLVVVALIFQKVLGLNLPLY